MYEQFRNDFLTAAHNIPCSELNVVLGILDRVATKYSFSRKETSIAIYMDELPEMAKTYLVVKKLAGLTDATLKNYKTVLEIFFKSLQKPPEQIVANDIRMFLYLYQQERGVSLKTLNKYREHIACFFSWASEEGYLPTNPAKNLTPIKYEDKPRTALTPIELEQLRAACKTTKEKVVIEVLYSTGCRVSELVSIKQSDIDWNEKSVHLFGKGRKHRISYLSPRAEVLIKDYIAGRKDDCEYLIVSDRKPYRPLHKDGIEKIVRQIAARTPFGADKTVTPHILRHTTATIALQRGMPITDISKLLGHEKIDTTMIYAKTSLVNIQAGHRKYIV